MPDPGPLAVVQCSVTARRGGSLLLGSWTDRSGYSQERHLKLDADHCCTLTIDLDEVPSRSFTSLVLDGSARRTVATLALQPGHSTVMLTPGW